MNLKNNNKYTIQIIIVLNLLKVRNYLTNKSKLHFFSLRSVLLLNLTAVLFLSCNETYTPKPRGYMRDNFPEKKYQLFDTIFPYSFEYPTYAKVIPDNHKLAEAYWANIQFPERNATIHLSYKNINNILFEFV